MLDRFIITTREKEAADEIRWATRKAPAIEVCLGKFEDIPVYDCVATAGNSFGLMDAGMDLAVVKYFGTQLMERIQQRILEDHLGEQPVGTCLIVETGHLQHPFVAHAPTMRIPMNIAGTDHVYLATWAVLTAIYRHNRDSEEKIRSLVCPAFGTGTGGGATTGGRNADETGIREFLPAATAHQSDGCAIEAGSGALRWSMGI